MFIIKLFGFTNIFCAGHRTHNLIVKIKNKCYVGKTKSNGHDLFILVITVQKKVYPEDCELQ